MKKLGSMILAVVLLMTGLAGCNQGGGADHTEAVTLSPEATSAALQNGVHVELGEYVLDGDENLTVTKKSVEVSKSEGYKVESYDIKLGDLTELSDFITLRIPYDTTYCEEGQDPSKCVGAKYKNNATGEWEDVLFEVDSDRDEIIIYTDHLSTYGVFHVKNEGRRNAEITNIYADISDIDKEQAMETLREYVRGGGVDGEEAAGLAAMILTAHNGLMGGIAESVGEVGFGTDLAGTILNMASLGSPTFDTSLADSAYKKMNKLGKVAAAVKIGAIMLSTEKTDADTLGLYKDTAMLALSYAESAAWGLAASGLFIFDYTITSLFEQGLAMKMDQINEVYAFFNDEYVSKDRQGFEWTARSLKDWRQVLIDIAEANPNEADAKAAIEAEIERYARVFWTLSSGEIDVVVSEMKKSSKGSATIPNATEAEVKAMVGGYKAQLYERLYPVIYSVSMYMQRKAEMEYLAALNEMKEFFNQNITFNIVEDIPEGEKSKYEDYALRFAPLSENAVKENWSGKLGDGGGGSTKFTLLGYIEAGCPKELQLFKPGDDLESDEPELSLNFKLSYPVTEVKLGGLPLEELLGTYSATFTFEDESDTYNFTFMYYEGQLVFKPESDDFGTAFLLVPGPYEYNPSTATATCEAANDVWSLSAHVSFISDGGTVRFSSDNTLEDIEEGRTVTTYGEGTKID